MRGNEQTEALESVARLLGVPTSTHLGLGQLLERTRKQLLQAAGALKLAGVSKLKKETLARRLLQALQPQPEAGRAEPAPPSARPVTPPTPVPPTTEEEPAGTAKLDLGPAARTEEPPAHIPWSYGQDRVTAAAVDPDTLYVYWEVDDAAIEKARAGLGPGGAGAWLDLRVYDTSGLIFDGTNAHGYFDHSVDRSTRQWFFKIGKPTSTAFVEIGMKSSEGFFVKIARAGRVDFPRRERAASGEPEWMTVRETGEVTHVARVGAPAPHGGAGVAPAPPPAGLIPLWVMRDPSEGDVRARHLFDGGWERLEWRELSGEGWFALEGRVEWEGPRILSSWEAGPFTYPVQVAPPRREEWEGRSFAYRVGDVTHVVYGPWQVVIRNLGGRRERTVLARWQVFRSWVAEGGRELRVTAGAGVRAGASELLGASERRWLGGSELRAAGASELWRIGASELMLRGASERLFVGASQWMFRGASEWRAGGASEWRAGGASERRLGGASESRLGGASERRLGGASERRLGGASESRLGGASELRHAAESEQRLEGTPAARLSAVDGSYPALTE